MNDEIYNVGVDIGGTFTDIVFLNKKTGDMKVHKILSTPKDFSIGVINGLNSFMKKHNIKGEQISTIFHGTTVAINALIERKGAKVGLITSKGFRDVLEIGREMRYDIYDLKLEMPEPLVPRYLRKEINERVSVNGSKLISIDIKEVKEKVQELIKEGVESIAVSFLHSYAYPENEQKTREIILSSFPNTYISLSSEISPEIREYERTATTVANSYLQPLVEIYIERLDEKLRQEINFLKNWYIMLSNGGIAGIDIVKKFPIYILESGPVAGSIAAGFYGKLLNEKKIFSLDMGGTTVKASFVIDGKSLISKKFEAARAKRFKKGSGIPLNIPVVEMIEIGVGGGSIAYIDSMGLLKVGPQSSGADPGPACYGLGGSNPTITDADLILGYLDPNYFLGGEKKLEVDAAYNAINDKCAKVLKKDVLEVANGIYKIATENMAAAAKIHLAEKGVDARKFTMFAFGGAGPVHAYHLAKKIYIKKIICPSFAGVMSAIGFLVSKPIYNCVHSYASELSTINWEKVNKIYQEMETNAKNILEKAGARISEVKYERTADMRYVGQGYEIEVPIPNDILSLSQEEKNEAIKNSFQRKYDQLFHSRTLGNIEIESLNWRLLASAPVEVYELKKKKLKSSKNLENAVKGKRKMYSIEKNGFVEAIVYDRYKLLPGMGFHGPAIVEERESTAIMDSNGVGYIDEYANLIIEIKED